MDQEQLNDFFQKAYRVAIAIFLIGKLFVIQHYPGGPEIYRVAQVLLVISFGAYFMTCRFKSWETHLQMVLIIFVALGLLSYFFQLSVLGIFGRYQFIASVIVIAIEVKHVTSRKSVNQQPDFIKEDYQFGQEDLVENPQEDTSKGIFWYLTYLSFGIIGLGILFRLMQWPGGSVLSIIGFGSAAVFIFLRR